MACQQSADNITGHKMTIFERAKIAHMMTCIAIITPNGDLSNQVPDMMMPGRFDVITN
jgi:hypothetical protein